MNEYLKVTRNGQILEIVLDHPKANTIDGPLSRAMGKLFAEFRDDPELRVAILTGAGERFFSAGWDLNGASGDEGYLDDYGEGGFGGFPEMTDLLKPVICAVNGLAAGGGFEILLRADFIVAAEHAEFVLPEVRIGMAPDVATFMLPKMLPRQKAFELLMTGRRQSARRSRHRRLRHLAVAVGEGGREVSLRCVLLLLPGAVAGRAFRQVEALPAAGGKVGPPPLARRARRSVRVTAG